MVVGDGQNGKSTFTESDANACGSYATSAEPSTS
jgi:phage/plasmid-associated DNA primase